MRRLPAISGERIDRSSPVQFTFEGRAVHGFRGDTITSALAAEGIRVLGRSFKYHRPRGLLSGAGHDVNALMQVRSAGRSVPNVRADVVPVEEGWDVTAVNTHGGLERDRLSILNRLAPFLPVGFYYKAFHSKRWFPRWERMFRTLAGLGKVDLQAGARSTAKRYDFCDVLVVGGGPSGLAAALAAAQRGATVLLVDEGPALGGSALYARGGAPDSLERTQSLISSVLSHPRITVASNTYAAGYYADHWVALVSPDFMTKVRARSVVIAQGAYEQPAVFHGNDLPGVMLASAAQRLLYHHAVAVARRVAIVTANAEGYVAALDALAHGIEVVALLDLRAAPGASSRALANQLSRVPTHYNVRSIQAEGEVSRLSFVAGDGAAHCLDVDGVWMSVGFAPANALLHQAGARMTYSNSVEQFIPKSLPAGVFACGKVNGVYTLEARLADGAYAGACAAAGLALGPEPIAQELRPVQECPTHPYPIFPHPAGREFVDFDEDLQIKDLVNACQEGFDSSELLKRYSTVGMGPSQGKHSNMNALRILAKVRGESIEALGTTTVRPMFHPVPLSHLAGRRFSPERRTPLDAQHAEQGAVWMPAGLWRRPEYYAVTGKSRAEAIAAEVLAVRTEVGIIDVGTLGKIEIHGPHAAEFLERVYTARFANLKVGMTRYGVMLDESGVVIDDGVIGRLGPESFYFTTTSGNSATLFREFGRLATWWGMEVGLVNLTGHYAAFNLAGPLSRTVLRQHTDLDLTDFPYQAIREANVAGAPCRIMRVGFVGELGYEIHILAEHATDVWRKLGVRPFGVEAQRLLRLEKGHIIVGQDTDGVTNPLELNMAWALKMDKPFFVGQRSLRALARLPRRQTLVGFTLPPGAQQIPKECHLVLDGTEIAGRVTSIGSSPTLNRCIGLALVTPAVASGKHLNIRIDGAQQVVAEIAALPFYDPAGDRQRVEDPA